MNRFSCSAPCGVFFISTMSFLISSGSGLTPCLAASWMTISCMTKFSAISGRKRFSISGVMAWPICAMRLIWKARTVLSSLLVMNLLSPYLARFSGMAFRRASTSTLTGFGAAGAAGAAAGLSCAMTGAVAINAAAMRLLSLEKFICFPFVCCWVYCVNRLIGFVRSFPERPDMGSVCSNHLGLTMLR